MGVRKTVFNLSVKSLVAFAAMLGLLSTFSPTASADYASSNMEQKVKAYSYYSVFNTECTLHNNIRGAGVNGYDWFNSGWGNKNSVDTPIGNLGCKSGSTDWIKDATQLWGFPSKAGDALCDLGYRQTATSSSSRSKCGSGATEHPDGDYFTVDRNGADAIRSVVMPKINDKHFGGSAPKWTPAMTYYASMQQLLDSGKCGLSTTEGTNMTAVKMSIVNADKQVEEKDYFIDESKTTRVQGYIYPDGTEQYATGSSTTPAKKTCFQLATTLKDAKFANAYTAYLANNPDEQPIGATSASDGEAEEQTSTCRIDGIGWAVCPVIRFLAGVTDSAYSAIEDMLTVPVSMFDTGSGTYKIWQAMRNLANVGFVIAFLMIIYSHLTSMGISNYNIKKMLPRLIVASILVNVSFWICALAVEISNILGYSLKVWLDDLSNATQLQTTMQDSGGGALWDTLAMTAIGAGVVTGAAFSLFSIAIFGPLIVTAAFTVFVVLAILTLRQALIVILIILSPIAFVLYLLPNTESWFKKWLSAFRGLLLIFPVIAVLFGGAAVAGLAVMDAASGYNGDLETADGRFLLQVMGAFITIAPLLMIGTIFNTIINIGGGTFGKFGALLNNPNKGPFDRARKAAEAAKERGTNTTNMRALKSRKFNPRATVLRRRGLRDAADNFHKQEVQRNITGFVADKATDPSSNFLQQMAGSDKSAQQRAEGSARATQQKLFAEEVTAASAVIEHLDPAQLGNLAIGSKTTDVFGREYNADKDLAMQAAAQKKVFDSTDQDAIEKVINTASTWDTTIKNSDGSVNREGIVNRERLANLADQAASSNGKPIYLGAGTLAGMRQGNGPAHSDTLKDNALRDNAYGMEAMVKADKDELAKMAQHVRNRRSRFTDAQVHQFRDNASEALIEPRFKGAVAKRINSLNDISSLT